MRWWVIVSVVFLSSASGPSASAAAPVQTRIEPRRALLSDPQAVRGSDSALERSFPAARLDAQRCDLVQFVTSLTRGDEDDVLISFGINDCDAGLVALPADLIVGFAFGCANRFVRSGTLTHVAKASASITASEGRWNASRGAAWSALMRPDGDMSIYQCNGKNENCPENLIPPQDGPCTHRGEHCASVRPALPAGARF